MILPRNDDYLRLRHTFLECCGLSLRGRFFACLRRCQLRGIIRLVGSVLMWRNKDCKDWKVQLREFFTARQNRL